jgi:serine-type D-Ala-D-Ala carboxypeptidase/endopeptidase (penicillin-binding protein 4)
MKRCILWLALALSASAQEPGELWRQRLNALPGGAGAASSFCLQDERGETLLQWNERRAVLPASTLKVVTAAGIVEKNGLQQQLRTRLEVRGKRVSWHGDYDPELSSGQLEAMAVQLSDKLPRSIELQVPPPDPEPYPPGWSWDDLSSSFAPPLSSLIFDAGLIPLKLRAEGGGAVTQLRVAGPVWAPPGGMDVLPRPGDFEMLVLPGWSGWVLGGTIPPGVEEAVTAPMLRPELATARLLGEVFRRRGIQVDVVSAPALGGPPDWEAVQTSRPVGEILKRGLADSDNLVLECLYRRFGRTRPAVLSGDPNLRIVDGSGLSRYNLLSARHLVATLQARPEVLALLPAAGLEGTLKRRFLQTALQSQLHAKTGTLSGVSGLTGEFTAASGRKLRFALLLNGFVGPAAPFKKAEEELLLELATRY